MALNVWLVGFFCAEHTKIGLVNVTSRLAENLSQIQDVHITVLSQTYIRSGMTNYKNLKVIKASILDPALWRRVITLYKKENPDIINFHGISELAVLIVTLKKLGIVKSPLVFSAHGSIKTEISSLGKFVPPHLLLLEKALIRNCVHITTVSEYFRNFLSKTYGINTREISVVYNGLDKEWFDVVDCERSHKCKKINPIKNQKKPVILFVGIPSHIKGVDLLIKALGFLKSKALLLIVGNRNSFLKQCLAETSFTLNEKHVWVLENLPMNCMKCIYDTADIFILPSRLDPCPLVVLEAMARGKPVIISEHVGLKNIMKNCVNGFIGPCDGVQDLASLIDGLLENKKLIAVVGEQARKKALERTWEVVALEYMDTYLSVLKHMRRAYA